MIVYFIAAAAFVATFLGGLLALRLRDSLHLILGFSAGAVVGVAFFDLLPEALNLGASYGGEMVLATTALGFLLYLGLDRLLPCTATARETSTHTAVRRAPPRFHSIAF